MVEDAWPLYANETGRIDIPSARPDVAESVCTSCLKRSDEGAHVLEPPVCTSFVLAIQRDVRVPDPAVRPAKPTVPLTAKVRHGVVVETPKLPPFRMVKAGVLVRLVEEAIINALVVEAYPTAHALLSEANWKVASPTPLASPIVVRPVASMEKSEVVAVAVELAIWKSIGEYAPLLRAWIDNFAYGVLEPMPRRSVVSFQKKLVASLAKVAPSLNWMAPAMPLAVPPPPPTHVPLTAKQPFLMFMPPEEEEGEG